MVSSKSVRDLGALASRDVIEDWGDILSFSWVRNNSCRNLQSRLRDHVGAHVVRSKFHRGKNLVSSTVMLSKKKNNSPVRLSKPSSSWLNSDEPLWMKYTWERVAAAAATVPSLSIDRLHLKTRNIFPGDLSVSFFLSFFTNAFPHPLFQLSL